MLLVVKKLMLKKNNVLLVLPVVLIAALQWGAYLFYPYFNVEKDIASVFLFSFFYINFILVVLWSSNQFEFKFKKTETSLLLKLVSIFFTLIFMFFIYKIISTFSVLNIAYIRNGYFNDEDLQNSLFINWIGRTLFRYYLVPFFWFFIVKMVVFTNRSFGWVVLPLLSFLIFSVLTGSRFSIYYLFVIVYFLKVINGNLTFRFVFAITLIGILLAVAGVIIKSPNPDKMHLIFFQFMECHIISPFYLKKAIEIFLLNFSETSFPFEGSLLNNALISLKATGVYHGGVPFFISGRDYNEFILYSSVTGKNYNAYAGIISVFFKDFSFLAPFFLFFLLVMLFYMIKQTSAKIGGPLYVYVLLFSFFSFYQMQLSNPGFQMIIFIHIAYSFLCRVSKGTA